MGVWVGGHRPESVNLFYDGSFLNLQHFDTKFMGAAQRRKKLRSKNRPNNGFYGVGIAWFELKSYKPVGLIGSICW